MGELVLVRRYVKKENKIKERKKEREVCRKLKVYE